MLRTRRFYSKCAIAFDIDGVLLHGNHPLKGAKEALSLLNKHNIPWILLTNGGGKFERDRADHISQLLNVPVHANQVCQSHTPFQSYANKHNTILVSGGTEDNCKRIARHYGFKNVYQPIDVVASMPSIWPYLHPLPDHSELFDAEKIVFDGIFVFNDPRNWFMDTQIILDLLIHKGQLRAIDNLPLYFSNPDLVWANEYPVVRIGQGGFKVCLEALYKEFTGRKLQSTTIGKPHIATYKYATGILNKWSNGRIENIYMIGDNPDSDILGANTAGWKSILVSTGVYKGQTLQHIPTEKKSNVLDAVNYVLSTENISL